MMLLELAERCEKAVFPCPDDASAKEIVAIRSAICHLILGRGYDAYSPDYIGSIDAAMTLVPGGLYPGVGQHGPAHWQANVTELNKRTWAGSGVNAALALCAAALRARDVVRPLGE